MTEFAPPFSVASPKKNQQQYKQNCAPTWANSQPKGYRDVASCSTAVPVSAPRLDFGLLNRTLISGHVQALLTILDTCTLEGLMLYRDRPSGSNGTFMHALVNRGSDGQLAAFLQHTLFLNHKAHWLNAPDIYGSPPLQNAANFNQTEKARLLVKAGASVRHVDLKTGRSLFQYAMVLNNDVMLEIFMKGLDFTPDLLDIPDKKFNFPPINYAVVNAREVMVMQLRAGGADLLWKDAKKRSLLILAITKAKNPKDQEGTGDYGMLQLLLRTECNSLIDEPDYRGHTPLDVALSLKRLDLVELLLKEGASITYSLPVSNENYLHRAIHHEFCEGLSLVLERACLCGDTMKTLYELFGQKNSRGQTPLEFAYRNGQHDAAQLLEKFGAGGPAALAVTHASRSATRAATSDPSYYDQLPVGLEYLDPDYYSAAF